MSQKQYTPVIIIGAPRSGTNMLRDMLCQFEDFGTWPCDEINYIWRHGNVKYPSDEFTSILATANVKQYVRRQFDEMAFKLDTKFLVEKTCANSLRVDFVNEIFPEAKFIFLVRDGIDIVDSAMKRWKAPLDIPYLLKKVPYVPTGDIPYYASRYLFSRLFRLFSSEKRLAFWGPKLDNMDDLLQQYSLEEVCLLQWQKCVNNSEKDFVNLPITQVHKLRYEDFVNHPDKELERIFEFLDVECDSLTLKTVVKGVSAVSVGKGRSNLDEEMVEHLTGLASETLRRYKYV